MFRTARSGSASPPSKGAVADRGLRSQKATADGSYILSLEAMGYECCDISPLLTVIVQRPNHIVLSKRLSLQFPYPLVPQT